MDLRAIRLRVNAVFGLVISSRSCDTRLASNPQPILGWHLSKVENIISSISHHQRRNGLFIRWCLYQYIPLANVCISDTMQWALQLSAILGPFPRWPTKTRHPAGCPALTGLQGISKTNVSFWHLDSSSLSSYLLQGLMPNRSLKNDCAQRDPNWHSQASAQHNWVSLMLHRAALKGSYNFSDLGVWCQWARAHGSVGALTLPGSAGRPRLCFVWAFPGKRPLADAEFVQFLSRPQLWAEDAEIYQEFLPNRGTKGPCTGCGNFPHVNEPHTVKDCRPNPSVLTQTKVHIDLPKISLQTPIQVNSILPGRVLRVWPSGCRCNCALAREEDLPQPQPCVLAPLQPPTHSTATNPCPCGATQQDSHNVPILPMEGHRP